MDLHIQYCPLSVARERGFKHYFTGAPCTRGGIYLRRTSDKKCLCSACKAVKAAQGKRYHSRNRERDLELMRRYAERNAEKIKKRRRKYYERNREVCLQAAAEKRKHKAPEIADYLSRWRKENPHVMREWRRRNSALVRFYSTQRHAEKIKRMPPWFGELDGFALQEAAELQGVRREQHGFEWQIDHLLPMRGAKVSGLHVAINFQVIPAHLNRFKKNRMIMTEPFEWLGYCRTADSASA